MIALPLAAQDPRLRALDATALLDAPPSPAFDRVTRLVQRLLDVPVSLVSLVDRDRQFFLSQAGLGGPWAEARETPLSHSFCQHVVTRGGPVRVANAPLDPAFCDNLAIRDLGVVGYLGVPVRAPGGAVLGSLCAITPEPREWTDTDAATLEELAAIVEAEVALQDALREASDRAAARRAAAAELQLALDAARLGRWEIDLEDGLVTRDAQTRAVHGRLGLAEEVTADEAVGSVHPDDRAEAVDAYQAMASAPPGARFQREYRVLGPDGDVHWVRAAGEVLLEDGRRRLVGVAWDVTDERAAEEALRVSARRKALQLSLLQGHRQSSDPQAMMQAAAAAVGRHLGVHGAGFFLVDGDVLDFGAVPSWSDGSAAPLTVRVPVSVLDADRLARVRAGEPVFVEDLAAEGRPPASPFLSFGIRSGVVVPVIRNGRWHAGLYLAHGAPRAWTDDVLAFVHDVADQVWDAVERAEAEAALRELNDELEARVAARTAELERSNAELDQFAYVASHDLKAPIRAIDSLAAWIAEDAADALPPASARHLELLRSRAARMEGLLDGLLTYSRVGRKEAAPEPVDMGALVRDAVATVAPPEGFDVRVAGVFPVVETARAPLELVVRNLVGNAIKHHDRPDGRVTVSARVDGGWAVVSVEDDGPGIEPAYQGRVFGLFQTLRPRDEVEGSGMGLSIVKKAVESRGGRISVASGGRGTRFEFTWPLRAGQPGPPPGPSA